MPIKGEDIAAKRGSNKRRGKTLREEKEKGKYKTLCFFITLSTMEKEW